MSVGGHGEACANIIDDAGQVFTLVKADSNPEAKAVAVLDFQMPGANPVYRALPVTTLFGEVAAKGHP